MEEILGFIAQYGILPVVVGVLLYLIILWQNRRGEREKIKAEESKEQNRLKLEAEREQRILKTIETLTQQINKTEHTPIDEENNRKLDEFIIRELDNVIKNGASRAYMMTFHNGVRDVLGRGFSKMSITHESVNFNQRQIMPDFQNMPRVLFAEIYKEINENGCYYIEDIENIRCNDKSTYNFLNSRNVKSSLFRAIRRGDGLLIGFISFEYCNSESFDFEKCVKDIENEAYKITGALLSNTVNEL